MWVSAEHFTVIMWISSLNKFYSLTKVYSVRWRKDAQQNLRVLRTMMRQRVQVLRRMKRQKHWIISTGYASHHPLMLLYLIHLAVVVVQLLLLLHLRVWILFRLLWLVFLSIGPMELDDDMCFIILAKIGNKTPERISLSP